MVIARYYGAKNKDYLQRAIHTTTAFGLVPESHLRLRNVSGTEDSGTDMGTPADVLESIVYFQTYFAGSLGVVMYNISLESCSRWGTAAIR